MYNILTNNIIILYQVKILFNLGHYIVYIEKYIYTRLQ